MVDFPMEVFVGLLMLVAALAIVFGFRRFLSGNSERRMRSMLEAVGLDPEIASSGDARRIMSEVRDRCRHCQSESVCERWLRGEKTGGNDFCPNQQVFELLNRYGGATS